MILEVNGVAIKAQLKANTKKANKALKNKNRMNKPVIDLTCKKSADLEVHFQ